MTKYNYDTEKVEKVIDALTLTIKKYADDCKQETALGKCIALREFKSNVYTAYNSLDDIYHSRHDNSKRIRKAIADIEAMQAKITQKIAEIKNEE